VNFDHQENKLDSGLRVVTVPMAVPTVAVLMMVAVGSRYEDPKVAGISHFLEHMVFKGTKKYPTALDIASAVDAVGAEFNAFTSKEYTGFYVKAASKDIEVGLDVLSQFMQAPMLRSEDLEREKGVIVEEINMYEDNPARRVGDLFDQLMFGGHELGWDVIGTKETVTALKREDFVAHMQSWYTSGNMVLGVAGDAAKIQDSRFKIQEYFGNKRINTQTAREIDKFTKTQTEARVKVHYKKTEQAHFGLGAHSLPRNHPDRYVQAVLATILGGNMSSRLFTEVREKRGLAYYVRTSVDSFAETGHLASFAGVTINKIEDAITAILEQYQKISKVGNVTAEELIKAKDYLKGKLLIELEDSLQVALEYTDSWLLEGRVRTPEEAVAGVEAVTLEDISRLATEILQQQRLNLVVLGPYKDSKKFEKLLS